MTCLHVVCFYHTLAKGGLDECYIISGGSVVLLYNVIWGGGCQNMDIFLLYNTWTTPKDSIVQYKLMCNLYIVLFVILWHFLCSVFNKIIA